MIPKSFEISSQNVVKLAGLIDGLAAALRVEPSRVRTAAAQLRKHKMILTGPRGPGAPEMTPADAVNLLLAIMYDGELAVAEQSVASLRAATVISCRHRVFGEVEDRLQDFPRNGFFGASQQPMPLGEVLETIIDWFVRYGTLEEGEDHDLDLDVVNLRLTVSSPGYLVHIHFNTHEGFWDLRYGWMPPEQLAYEREVKGNLFAATWDGLSGPHLWTSRTVADDSLFGIADSLRGREWNETDEEITPPYDQAPCPRSEKEPA